MQCVKCVVFWNANKASLAQYMFIVKSNCDSRARFDYLCDPELTHMASSARSLSLPLQSPQAPLCDTMASLQSPRLWCWRNTQTNPF